ncbi:MAG: hypothetical protein JW874_08175 [Spirochaetales bacterium]|nr:hypothetical protein [Spirochaetales bacterium]
MDNTSGLSEKIRKRESGLCFFSFTPPRFDTSVEKLDRINKRRSGWLRRISPDGVMIYDVQDEEVRTGTARTYVRHEYSNTIEYAENLRACADFPQICFAALSGYGRENFISLLDGNTGTPLVPVGYPAPGISGNISLTDAYSFYKQKNRAFPLGGIAIAERHLTLRDEAETMLFKISRGVDFFVSQCIYNPDIVIRLLKDYGKACRIRDIDCRPVIFSFSPVLQEEDIGFLKWLGIDMPRDFINGFSKTADRAEIVSQHIGSTVDMIVGFCESEGIPWGLNFESIIGRRAEMDLAVSLAEKEYRKCGRKTAVAEGV